MVQPIPPRRMSEPASADDILTRESFESVLLQRSSRIDLTRNGDGYADVVTQALWAGFKIAQALLHLERTGQ